MVVVMMINGDDDGRLASLIATHAYHSFIVHMTATIIAMVDQPLPSCLGHLPPPPTAPPPPPPPSKY